MSLNEDEESEDKPVLIEGKAQNQIKADNEKNELQKNKEKDELIQNKKAIWKWGSFFVKSLLSGLSISAIIVILVVISYFFTQDKTKIDESIIKSISNYLKGAFLFGTAIESWNYTRAFMLIKFQRDKLSETELLKLEGGISYLLRPVIIVLLVSFFVSPIKYSELTRMFSWNFGSDEFTSFLLTGALFSIAGFYASLFLSESLKKIRH